MEEGTKKTRGLTGNALKLIALFSMTLDHVGVELLPGVTLLRIVGRLAFPLFAFMIAEGCAHTRRKGRYLGLIAGEALLCQLVYFFAESDLTMSILVTFSLSIVLIFTASAAKEKRSSLLWAAFALECAAVLFLTVFLPSLIGGFKVDYGFFGVMLPLFVYAIPSPRLKPLGAAAALTGVCLASGWAVQWYSFFALPLLFLYSGERGKMKLKYLFYVYYPLHLVLIWAIGQAVR